MTTLSITVFSGIVDYGGQMAPKFVYTRMTVTDRAQNTSNFCPEPDMNDKACCR
ncbi:MAG: hypothetical protein RIR97_366 [Pseudomonadota bacterium]